jgi:hypothetical protein
VRNEPDAWIREIGREQQIVIPVPDSRSDLVWCPRHLLWLLVHVLEVEHSQLLLVA